MPHESPAPEGLNEDRRYEEFLTHFTRVQGAVLAYIRSLVHDPAGADDVFQTASLTLWRRFDSFHRGEPFLPWALGIARHEVLHYWRSRRRDRLVFSEAALAHLADAAVGVADEADQRQEALEACVKGLPERQRQLVAMFYDQRLPADQIAAAWGRTVHAVYKSLKVLRRSLLDCVERRLVADG